jgi:hypothetical protein
LRILFFSNFSRCLMRFFFSRSFLLNVSFAMLGLRVI